MSASPPTSCPKKGPSPPQVHVDALTSRPVHQSAFATEVQAPRLDFPVAVSRPALSRVAGMSGFFFPLQSVQSDAGGHGVASERCFCASITAILLAPKQLESSVPRWQTPQLHVGVRHCIVQRAGRAAISGCAQTGNPFMLLSLTASIICLLTM